MADKWACIGIDLGTTYSSIAYVGIHRSGPGIFSPKPTIATDIYGDQDSQFIPSDVCAYLDNNELYFVAGRGALGAYQKFEDYAHLYRGYKYYIGRTFPGDEGSLRLPKAHPNGAKINLSPNDIAKELLKHLFELAFDRKNSPLFSYDVLSISISVPAQWPDQYKLTVENIVKEVRFRHNNISVQTIEEPIAALYHQIYSAPNFLVGSEKHVMVVDYGGGTCDVAIIKIKQDADKLITEETIGDVIGRGSNPRGGLLVDKKIAKYLIEKLGENKIETNWLIAESEKLKIAYSKKIRELKDLGEYNKNTILTYSLELPSGRRNIEMTADRFYNIVKDELKTIQIPIQKAVQDANQNLKSDHKDELSLNDIHHVFLVGGMALFPFVEDVVKDVFGKSNTFVEIICYEPRYAIAFGAALHSYHIKTGMGLGIGLTLQENIYLESLWHAGITIAKKGAVLPYTYRDTFYLLSSNVKEINIGLYKGASRFVTNDDLIGQQIQYKLSKPARFFTKFNVEVKILENGLLNFKISRSDNPSDELVIERIVPFVPDTLFMAERAGIDFLA